MSTDLLYLAILFESKAKYYKLRDDILWFSLEQKVSEITKRGLNNLFLLKQSSRNEIRTNLVAFICEFFLKGRWTESLMICRGNFVLWLRSPSISEVFK